MVLLHCQQLSLWQILWNLHQGVCRQKRTIIQRRYIWYFFPWMEIWHCWTPRIVLYFHLLLDHKFSPKEFTLETSQWSCFWMEHLIGQIATRMSRVLGALSTALRQMKIVALLLTRSLLIHYKVAYICKVTVVLLHFISYLLHPITETLREHPQRAILETCDLWNNNFNCQKCKQQS